MRNWFKSLARCCGPGAIVQVERRSRVGVGIGVGIVAVLLALLSLAPASDSAYLPGRVLVKLRPGLELSGRARVVATAAATTEDRDALLADARRFDRRLREAGAVEAESLGAGSQTYEVVLETDADAAWLAEQFAAEAAVVFAEPNGVRSALRKPNDQLVPEQWSLENIQAFDAWNITTGSGVVVAVIDTGVSASHPDLVGQVLPGYNAILDNDDSDDTNGHGTAIAGLIGAHADNTLGIAGVCWGCQILPVKVLDTSGSGRDADLVRGIRWAADQGVQVINLSLGGARESQSLQEAIAYAFNRGSVMVAASGNDHRLGNLTNYPAAYPQVIAVGAVGTNDGITSFSTTGSHIDLVAPGLSLWATAPGGDYGVFSGTSFSSGFISGASALVRSLRPDLGPSDVACILEASADDRGQPGKDPEYGWGRVNVFRALQLAQTYTTCPLPAEPAEATPPPPPAPADSSPLSVPAENAETAFGPAAPIPTTSGQHYFPETRHTLSGEFLGFWQRQGGLAVFGFPISEVYREMGNDGVPHLVQFFERHRLELHQDQPEPYRMQLSRLGDEVLAIQGAAGSPLRRACLPQGASSSRPPATRCATRFGAPGAATG
ncbi:MAG: peptidase S8 [Chloroflexaceae bacterium]|nr:peptidase S8 [Chloroflexaceae bacterium]